MVDNERRKLKFMRYKLQRFWETIRYDLPRFIRNLRRFRKALWHYRTYDPHGIYVFNHIGLSNMAEYIEKYGLEIDESRLKKVQKMRRAAELYKNFMEGNFIDQAEAELGELIIYPIEFEPSDEHPSYFVMKETENADEKAHNKAVFDRAREIEEEQWNELFDILRGQDYSKFDKEVDWYKQFDGTGLRGWWD